MAARTAPSTSCWSAWTAAPTRTATRCRQEELATLRAGDDEATNTDTIILVRIPNNGKSATAISIPRDSYVDAPGIGKMKINGVYGSVHLEKMKKLVEEQGVDPSVAEPQATEAGREALIKTVANLTGVTVDHYAEIGLLGFALITDALGGVNVCLKDAVYEPLSGADFPAGWQKLDGPQALSFVRQRHDLPRGDLDRVVRQQAVMASLAHQVISGKTLSSPATLNRLQDAVQRSVVLSDGWDVMEFAEQLQKLAAGNVAFATIPVLHENGWSDDGMQSVVRIDANQVQDWVDGLLQDQDQGKTEELAYTPSKTAAEVVNATDINGLAAAVSAVLTSDGFARGRWATTTASACGAARCLPPRPMTLARRRFPKTWAGCRSSLTRRCRRDGAGGARQRLHRPGLRPGWHRSDAGDGRSGGHRVDGRRSPAVADHHRRLGQPRVRQLTYQPSVRRCSTRC